MTSTTFCAAGIVLVSPQNESGGGSVLPDGDGVGDADGDVYDDVPECTANSNTESPYWVARAVM